MSIAVEINDIKQEIKECEEYLSKVRSLEDRLVKLRYSLLYLETPVFNEYGHYGEDNKALDGWEYYEKEDNK